MHAAQLILVVWGERRGEGNKIYLKGDKGGNRATREIWGAEKLQGLRQSVTHYECDSRNSLGGLAGGGPPLIE